MFSWRKRFDDASGGAHFGPLILGKIARQVEDVADGHVPIETGAPGVNAEFFQAAQLVGAALLKIVLWCGHGRCLLLRSLSKMGVPGVRHRL